MAKQTVYPITLSTDLDLLISICHRPGNGFRLLILRPFWCWTSLKIINRKSTVEWATSVPFKLVRILRMAVSAFSSKLDSTKARSWTMMRCEMRKMMSTLTTRDCWQKRHPPPDSCPKCWTRCRSFSEQSCISLSCRDIRSILLSFLTGREIWNLK